MNSSYQRLLLPAPRLLFASLFTFFIVQKADLLVFSKLKTKCSSFLAKNLYSLLSSQLLDTILFTFLGLYGLVASCFDVLLLSYLVKVAIIFSLSPLTHLFQKWIPLPRPYRS